MTDGAHPLDWHFPAFWTGAVLALVVAYVWATRAPDRRPTRRQGTCFALGTMALVLALTWPLGDLAAHWSLLALVVQRLLLMLAVPPLLVMGTPAPLITALTRPPPVDALLRLAVRPLPAVLLVTGLAVGTLTTGAVALAASSAAARVLFQLLILLAGFILWAPVLPQLPGTHHLSSLARGGYLIVQSIVPGFLSIVWIFARRPLYPAYSHHIVAGMSPLLDQQLSGFAAKLTTIAVLWTVAYVTMARSSVTDGGEEEDGPLIWSDVEREIERADRRERWSRWLPPSVDPPPGPSE